MICVHCQQHVQETSCPHCQTTSQFADWQRLANLDFILTELNRWPQIRSGTRQRLTRHYRKAREAEEVRLGLREPPPTPAEIESIRQEIRRAYLWLRQLRLWQENGWVAPEFVKPRAAAMRNHINTLEDRLEGLPLPPHVARRTRLQLNLHDHLWLKRELQNLDTITYAGLIDLSAIVAAVEQAIDSLQRQLGTHPRPKQSPLVTPLPPEPAPTPQPRQAKRSQRIPWTWDRFWETLLSERTLQAILFLGAALLLAAGVSWVAWNWGAFPVWVQLSFLVSFTGFFFVLGWYVLQKQKLRGSGLALIGVGALLVPLDIYAFYLSGGLPADSFPSIWLFASLSCFIIYLSIALSLRASFFGYLVGLALGSLAVASANLLPNGLTFWSPVSMTSALTVATASLLLNRIADENRLKTLSHPFMQLALVWTITILAVGSLLESRNGFFQIDALLLALNFALGGAVCLCGLSRYRFRSLLLLALASFPVAIGFGGWWLSWDVPDHTPFIAVGWAAAAPLYLIAATKWPFGPAPRQPLWQAAALTLILFATIWSLGDLLAVGLTYLLLGGTIALAALRKGHPTWLYLATLYVAISLAALQGFRGVTVAELSLPWTLLALVLLAIAVNQRRVEQQFGTPLLLGGYFISGIAILPAALFFNHSLLIYAVGNWIGVNIWLLNLGKRGHPAAGSLGKWKVWETATLHWGMGPGPAG